MIPDPMIKLVAGRYLDINFEFVARNSFLVKNSKYPMSSVAEAGFNEVLLKVNPTAAIKKYEFEIFQSRFLQERYIILAVNFRNSTK